MHHDSAVALPMRTAWGGWTFDLLGLPISAVRLADAHGVDGPSVCCEPCRFSRRLADASGVDGPSICCAMLRMALMDRPSDVRPADSAVALPMRMALMGSSNLSLLPLL